MKLVNKIKPITFAIVYNTVIPIYISINGDKSVLYSKLISNNRRVTLLRNSIFILAKPTDNEIM